MFLRARALLLGLAAAGLLLAACGGDDDDGSSDETTTTTEAPDESTDEGGAATDGETTGDELDVCSLIDIELVNSVTGETFTTAEQTEADTCQVTDDAQSTLLQLSVKPLEEGETEEGFVEDGAAACDEGTEVEVDVSAYADAGVACEISGEVALLVAVDDGGALLIGHPSDPSLTNEQIITALEQIMQDIVTP